MVQKASGGSFPGPEVLDDLGHADVTSGQESDEPDGEVGDVADQPQVHVALVWPVEQENNGIISKGLFIFPYHARSLVRY